MATNLNFVPHFILLSKRNSDKVFQIKLFTQLLYKLYRNVRVWSYVLSGNLNFELSRASATLSTGSRNLPRCAIANRLAGYAWVLLCYISVMHAYSDNAVGFSLTVPESVFYRFVNSGPDFRVKHAPLHKLGIAGSMKILSYVTGRTRQRTDLRKQP